MIRLLSATDSWALAQICVDHIQITKDQYLAAIIEPAAGRSTAFYDDAAPVIAAFRWEPNGSAELERLCVENDLLKVGQPRGCSGAPKPDAR